MTYQPNIWLMNDLHRRIVRAAAQFGEYTTLLRPIRRHIFLRMFQLPEDVYVPEFFRPCFAVLARNDDPEKKPCLVIETDDPGQRMKDLYSQHGILWVQMRQETNKFLLECSHGGTLLQVSERTGSLFKLLAAPLAWSERNVSFPQGSFVHSHSERLLREAVNILSPSFRIEIHHQIPLSFVLGVKDDLTADERKLLNFEIDAVIIQSIEADPDGGVILPVKLDIHDSHRQNEQVRTKDEQVRSLCDRFEIPLMTVSLDAQNCVLKLECSTLGLPDGTAEQKRLKILGRGPCTFSWCCPSICWTQLLRSAANTLVCPHTAQFFWLASISPLRETAGSAKHAPLV